jgi:hypothetical protein
MQRNQLQVTGTQGAVVTVMTAVITGMLYSCNYRHVITGGNDRYEPYRRLVARVSLSIYLVSIYLVSYLNSYSLTYLNSYSLTS